MLISAWTFRSPPSDNCGSREVMSAIMDTLRRLGAVHSPPLVDPSVDNLLLELFLTQWVSFAPVLIRGAGIDALEPIEISMTQCRISRNVRERLFHRFAH